MEIARGVAQASLEVMPDKIDFHPGGIREPPQDVGPGGAERRGGRHLPEQLACEDRISGVEEMAGGLDTAAKDRLGICGWGESPGKEGELSRRLWRTPSSRQTRGIIERRGSRCVGASRPKGEVPGRSSGVVT